MTEDAVAERKSNKTQRRRKKVSRGVEKEAAEKVPLNHFYNLNLNIHKGFSFKNNLYYIIKKIMNLDYNIFIVDLNLFVKFFFS